MKVRYEIKLQFLFENVSFDNNKIMISYKCLILFQSTTPLTWGESVSRRVSVLQAYVS